MPPAAGRRTRLEPEARRAQLIELGLEMLATCPLERLSTDDVATAAGISRSLLFHYFPTKRDFLVALVRAASRALLDATDTDPALPSSDRLRLGLEAYVAFVSGNSEVFIALVRGAAGSDDELRGEADRARAEFAARVLDGLGQDGPGSSVVALAATGWVALTEQVVVTWLGERAAAPGTGLDPAELVDFLQAALVGIMSGALGRDPGQVAELARSSGGADLLRHDP